MATRTLLRLTLAKNADVVTVRVQQTRLVVEAIEGPLFERWRSEVAKKFRHHVLEAETLVQLEKIKITSVAPDGGKMNLLAEKSIISLAAADLVGLRPFCMDTVTALDATVEY